MAIHPRAGQTATQEDLIDIPKLISQYYSMTIEAKKSEQQVSFGTSGHRGSSLNKSFNQPHIFAITQAVIDYRRENSINGELIIGFDTHALSYSAYISALQVAIANKQTTIVHQGEEYTPTPVISHAIISRNEVNIDGMLCDGLVITPSHNPPQDGGIKYNLPHGGPADTKVTRWIETRANHYLTNELNGVQIVTIDQVNESPYLLEQDLITPYVTALEQIVDMDAIAKAKINIGVDPLGGSGIHYWQPIAKHYDVDLTVINDAIDPRFSFMSLDKDGKIRMDCSSPFAMSGLLTQQDNYDLCIANDPDFDRHGIVCPKTGLMNPNHFLAVAIDYLLTHRPQWSTQLKVGKTTVSSAMIDRVCAEHGRQLFEVPVGFKWFVDGLSQGQLAFGGEESAGAAFLKQDGTTWCTDKDGFIMTLLAAEIIAVTGETPAQRYQALVEKHGECFYQRVDSPVTLEKKSAFNKLISTGVTIEQFSGQLIAGEAIVDVMTHAVGNQAPIGGIKVVTKSAWFAARPSGTEAVFKLYGESFISESHLTQVLNDAQRELTLLLN